MRPNTHYGDALGSRKMPTASRRQAVQVEHAGVEDDLPTRRLTRSLLWVVTYIHRVLVPGRRQIRILRGLQISVWRPIGAECEQDGRVPRRVGKCRVLGRHCVVSPRGNQSAHADGKCAGWCQPRYLFADLSVGLDTTTLCAYTPRGMEQSRRGRGCGRALQGSVSLVGPTNPVHNGQVCNL